MSWQSSRHTRSYGTIILCQNSRLLNLCPQGWSRRTTRMMRQVIRPTLRQLGFRGTVREFKYGDRSQFGAVR